MLSSIGILPFFKNCYILEEMQEIKLLQITIWLSWDSLRVVVWFIGFCVSTD